MDYHANCQVLLAPPVFWPDAPLGDDHLNALLKYRCRRLLAAQCYVTMSDNRRRFLYVTITLKVLFWDLSLSGKSHRTRIHFANGPGKSGTTVSNLRVSPNHELPVALSSMSLPDTAMFPRWIDMIPCLFLSVQALSFKLRSTIFASKASLNGQSTFQRHQ